MRLANKQPGWSPWSYGYHSDDGTLFHNTGTRSTPYGPKFGAGDVIGCGINYYNQTVFFTLNGRFLGTAIEGPLLPMALYPVIGIDSPSPVVLNFGDCPFRFDVRSYERAQFQRFPSLRTAKRHLSHHLTEDSERDENSHEGEDIDQFVLSFLRMLPDAEGTNGLALAQELRRRVQSSVARLPGHHRNQDDLWEQMFDDFGWEGDEGDDEGDGEGDDELDEVLAGVF